MNELMNYSSDIMYLSLEGHVDLEKYRYVYFVFVVTLYLMIISCNGLVIYIIFTNKSLHEPMYIFIAALLCNDLFGSMALYPKLLTDLLSEIQVISFEFCIFQSFCIYTYGASEFTLLSAMAYDRYVSICKPLQYNSIVKMSTVKILLFCCWFLPCCEVGIGSILTYQRKLCKFKLNRIYCDDSSMIKLACGDFSVSYIFGLVILSIVVFPPLIFVFFSYSRILSVCLMNPKDFRRKAIQTCLPHLVVFTTLSITACFIIIHPRLEGNMPHVFSMIMSVEILVIPPLLNPIIYGLKLKQILNRIKKIILKRKTSICHEIIKHNSTCIQ
ncbi:olfactory receptor 6N2-like [Clarias gariepinus]|uniref:olfactory receptor 6N2-like n=1 Tax=Clarias gariepinus TaxID=13013 RepID=UPI00234CFE62|nr:olfactory receptor 6N2-like [Clarias gariepinus]